MPTFWFSCYFYMNFHFSGIHIFHFFSIKHFRKTLIQLSLSVSKLSVVKLGSQIHPTALYYDKDCSLDWVLLHTQHLWMLVVTKKKKWREWETFELSQAFAIKKHNWGGVQWRVQRTLNRLPNKWSTVYLRGQIGQTVSNYPSIEGKDFLLLLFFSPFLSCVCERAASFQLTNQRSLLT